MRNALTDRQRRVLEFIRRSTLSRGYPPTLREIGEELGIRSTNGVSDHLKALERKGYLERDDLKSRALRPVGMSRSRRPVTPQVEVAHVPESGELVSIPVLGRVAAGQPILAVENVETTVQIDRYFVGKSEELFALRVKGDSMIQAGICDGDFIFVRKQLTARPGEIVVALIDDEATVKRYYPEGDRIRFESANPEYAPIIVPKQAWRSVNLLGLVVGVYRKL